MSPELQNRGPLEEVSSASPIVGLAFLPTLGENDLHLGITQPASVRGVLAHLPQSQPLSVCWPWQMHEFSRTPNHPGISLLTSNNSWKRRGYKGSGS